MKQRVTIKPLVECRSYLSNLVGHFENEWPEYYGAVGRGNARSDLESYANIETLPVGVVALVDDKVCGFMALKADSISTRADLGPWVAAGFVVPGLRGQGIGSILLKAIEEFASTMEFEQIYSGTEKAHNLLFRAGWHKNEDLVYDGADISIFSNKL